MDPRLWRDLSNAVWLVFLAYWIYSARKLKAIKQREPGAQRIVYLVVMMCAYTLLFSDGFNFGPLQRRIVPNSALLGICGVVLSVLGVGLAIWARKHLGENWSATVTLKKDHELIRSGPYRQVRHPIYSGMLLAMIGVVLVLGEIRGLAGFVVAAASFYFKARKEERFLAAEFGPAFAEHTRRTGMFLPRLTT
ncbi:MAG TPA: isoprenylcysteine carboxylmethyltransferase family protein [Candidatus Angelobacter sp.]|nr:isoprenylcysteine carboxylmethyltransferase family protein [Candidatus Angelobacter sp.]